MDAVLIVGGGGREHALADALAQSPRVGRVFMTKHNAATAAFTELAAFDDYAAMARFCRRQEVELVVVGPEAPLAAGIADALLAAQVRVLGPTKQAARLESSKVYAKRFMRRCGIPTGEFAVCDDIAAVRKWLRAMPPPYVLKADGLAGGKGVEIHADAAAADAAAAAILGGKYAAAGRRLLLEEFAAGEEMSFIVLARGEAAVPLASCRDYKRLRDGDDGPNTGGMGVVSPAPAATAAREAAIMRRVIAPALAGLEAEGAPFCGFLYAGLMIDGEDIKVLEFNCRLGDPEAQAILPRLDGDWYAPLRAAADGDLRGASLSWRGGAAAGVVLAAAGYPQSPRAGDIITLPDAADAAGVRIYHAGTRRTADGDIVTDGGRVLVVTATAATRAAARERAYAAAAAVHFDGMQYRRDIAAG